MTTEIRTFEGKTLYRYLPLTKEDKEDLEKFSAWNSSNKINVSKNYIDSIAHDKDHRLIYLLANKKLYRTTPSGFNDPYDCLVEIYDKVADENLLNWLRLYYKNQAFCSNEWQQKEARLLGYINDNNVNKINDKDKVIIIELIKSTLQRIVNKSRVICFSKGQENLLMWAHYADKHSGYCLTFDVKKLKNNNCWVGLYEVDYPPNESRPLIKLSPEEFESFELAKKILLTKSIHWKYEEEVRLTYNDPNKYFDFKAEALTEIVFGAKMSPEYQTGFKFLIKTMSKQKNEWRHVSCYNAKLDPKKYVVNIV